MENVLAEMSTLDMLKVVHSPSKTAQLEPFPYVLNTLSVLCIHVKTLVQNLVFKDLYIHKYM